MKGSLAVACCVHDDLGFLRDTVTSFAEKLPTYCFVNKFPTEGRLGNWRSAAEVAKEHGANIVLGEWPAAILHRQGSIQYLADHGYSHAIMPEGSEVIDASLFESLCKVAKIGLAERVYVERDICWKSIGNAVATTRPELLMIDIQNVWPDDVNPASSRMYGGGRHLVLNAEHGKLHYLTR